MQSPNQPSPFNSLPYALTVLGFLICVGLLGGAYVLGAQTKSIGGGKSTVTVKGLAEKNIQADLAEWQVVAHSQADTMPQALNQLREQKKQLDQFLTEQGFDATVRIDGSESVAPRFVETMVNGRYLREQDGFEGRQKVVVRTKALDSIAKASKAILDYQAAGHDVAYETPSYLVTQLDDIKLSLINAATENAKKRGQEFVRNSDVQLGVMRSASQGAFYILADEAGASADDYGGTYDKSTVKKIARVVVSIEYSLQ